MLVMITKEARKTKKSKVDDFCESKKNDDDESSDCDVKNEKINCRKLLEDIE